MSEPIFYLDTSEVRDGAHEELKVAVRELAAFVDANEPRILGYNVYLSEDGKEMRVMHVHPDPASLEFHMRVAGPAFPRFADLITLSSIHLFGRPGEEALRLARAKAEALGRGDVVVHEPQAGFARFAVR